jgi:heme oxygenase
MGLTRDTLKDHTTESHRRLDETELVKGLSEGTLSDAAYGVMLGVYHDFFHQFEETMKTEHPELVKEVGEFRFSKTGWIEEDLAKLGGRAGAGSRCDYQLPDSFAAIAGSLYVVEGSTLGGFHLSKSGRGFPADAGRFYGAYGSETISAWKEFIAWLEQRITQPDEKAAACEAAVRTFDWFEAKFGRAWANQIE